MVAVHFASHPSRCSVDDESLCFDACQAGVRDKKSCVTQLQPQLPGTTPSNLLPQTNGSMVGRTAQ